MGTMGVTRHVVADLAGMDLLARELARGLGPGSAVLLSGPLGAGKTSLARALLRVLTEDAALEVPSPSYTLVQTYRAAAGLVHHFDLWRLPDSRGVAELGWDEAREGIVLVEWPDRLGDLTPLDALRVEIAVGAEEQRLVTVRRA